ncbi:transcriptional regulator [uncultured Oscillibacter sp.]|uniref:transcriptional regulator n=1 Tax=uncultured Oscillibacter sp. TaxID=876091 RepID=UPI0025DCA36F|nr:transcriptional regulator [uncultured Oscillibacter sp.]
MIFVEDERVKLNGVVLPGLIKSIEVTETAKVDEQEVEGSATKPKQATGYEDAKVNIELVIDDTESQTKYERYAVLREIFRKPGQSVPQPIPIVCEDAAAHGVEKVIFKRLTHKGENKKSQLVASLELWEYIPQTITAAKSSGSGQSSGNTQSSSISGAKAPAVSSGLGGEYQEYLSSDRGTASAADLKKRKRMESKRNKSPAVDNAKAEGVLGKIAALPY